MIWNTVASNPIKYFAKLAGSGRAIHIDAILPNADISKNLLTSSSKELFK